MTTPVQTVTPTLELATDKQVYDIGDLLTLTATYSDGSVAPVTLSITASASDAAGNVVTAEIDVTVNTQVQQPMQVGVSDSSGQQYTLVSNEAGVAVLTTTIQAPPAS